MGDNSKLITHRCTERPSTYGIRRLDDRYCKGWYLMRRERDWDWDTDMYLPVAKINYCPFCGERLVIEECVMIPSFTKPTTLDDCQEFCCSACGEYMVLQQFSECLGDMPNFCPNCGAKVIEHEQD